jgi:ribosomal protein L24
MSNIDYGFDTTDEVKYDAQGLPLGTYKAMIVGEEQFVKNGVDVGVVAEYEAVSGDFKGKRGKVWYLTKHENPTTANIAKQNIKRIADATGKAVTAATPLKGRVLTITVAPQKNDPDRTEIKKYAPEDAAITDEPPL